MTSLVGRSTRLNSPLFSSSVSSLATFAKVQKTHVANPSVSLACTQIFQRQHGQAQECKLQLTPEHEPITLARLSSCYHRAFSPVDGESTAREIACTNTLHLARSQIWLTSLRPTSRSVTIRAALTGLWQWQAASTSADGKLDRTGLRTGQQLQITC